MCREYSGAPNFPTWYAKYLYEGADDIIVQMLRESDDLYEFTEKLESYCESTVEELETASLPSGGLVREFFDFAWQQIDWGYRAELIWGERESYWGVKDEEEEDDEIEEEE